MKNLTLSIKQLVLLCALLVSTFANAGLIKSNVTDNAWFANESANFDGYYSIANLGSVSKNTYGDTLWQIDLVNVSSLSFSMAFSLSPPIFSSFSVLLMDSQSALSLKNYTTNVGKVERTASIEWYQEEIELSRYDLSQFTDINEVNLVFRHTAIEDSPRNSLRSRNSRSSQSSIAQAFYKNINFASKATGSTPVPEPTSMVLFLIALAYMGRKHFTPLLTKTPH